MDRPGGIPGGMISELRNLHSQRLYLVSTAPEQGQDFWTIAILPTVERKGWFGLSRRLEPDPYHPVATIVRNNREDAYRVHAEVRHIVGTLPEEKWFEALPSPRPPEGYSPGARAKLISQGVDPD